MRKGFELVKIKKIEFTEEECEMCDLEIPRFHNFILANGIVTHNSANLEVNTIRQADYMILKPSSLLQRDFERKKIKEIYEESKEDFDKHKDTLGLTYIYSNSFRGFITNNLPSFWSEKVSKAFNKH